jgi:RNA polymerase sigma-70 factor (ECF subfamily)
VTDESALLNRAQAYDPEALAELYDRYAPRMYAYIYRRVSDSALAEDLTSELFVRVLRSVRNSRAWRGSFLAWLYRIAHNLVVDSYRRQPAASPVSLDDALTISGEGDPVEAVQDTQARERLQAAIRCLTPEQQEVLALRFGEGLATREVAQVLRKSSGAVEALQRRALATLQRLLAGERAT